MKTTTKRKPTRKGLTKTLDGLCREVIRLRDDNRCQRCGKYIQGQNSHPSHVVAKGKGASIRRWDLLNIKLLCFHCHRWWHDNPTESGAWFRDKWPHRDAYLNIYRGGKPCPITTDEMIRLAEGLKEKLRQLQIKGVEQ